MAVNQDKPLHLNKLVKKYGDFTAVNEVTMTMEPGEIFGLLGPNGAGKTSIISCLVTLQEPTSGCCEIFGYDPVKNPLESKLLTGIVPQEIINHGYFNVEEILQFHSGYYCKWNNQSRIDYLLKRMGLWDHRHKKVKALSGGMKRRLLICKALVHSPKLLLLDEPTAGVDVELRNSLWEFVCELKEQGTSILLTTHYLEEAEKLCDRVGILQDGHLRTIGETQELIKKLTERKVTLYFDGTCDESVSSPYLQSRKDNKGYFVIPQGVGIGELLSSLKCDVHKVVDVEIEEGSLEEAFVRVLGENKA